MNRTDHDRGIIADIREQIDHLDLADQDKAEAAEENLICIVQTLLDRLAARDARIEELETQLKTTRNTALINLSEATRRAARIEELTRERDEQRELKEHARRECDKAEHQVAVLREALRANFCPRPANSRPDEFDVGQCVDADECGCMNHVLRADQQVMAAIISPDENGWMPIDENTPRVAGELLMLWDEDVAHPEFASWSENHRCWVIGYSYTDPGVDKDIVGCKVYFPTHWQPLPKPPVRP